MAGQLFKEYLGKKEYNEHMLMPFERFLYASFQNFCNWFLLHKVAYCSVRLHKLQTGYKR